MRSIIVFITAVALVFSTTAQAERIKDIANVAGVRPNQLVGYGLVVGLDGTGDQVTQSHSLRNHSTICSSNLVSPYRKVRVCK